MTTIKGTLKLQPSRANILLKKKFKFYFEIVYNFSINSNFYEINSLTLISTAY